MNKTLMALGLAAAIVAAGLWGYVAHLTALQEARTAAIAETEAKWKASLAEATAKAEAQLADMARQSIVAVEQAAAVEADLRSRIGEVEAHARYLESLPPSGRGISRDSVRRLNSIR